MIDSDGLTAVVVTISSFGGTALIIWTSMKARIARIKAEAEARRITAAPVSDSSVTAELKAFRQQIADMSSTGHQFDLSFDEALNRLEGRINRLETKAAAAPTVQPTDTDQTLRNGRL